MLRRSAFLLSSALVVLGLGVPSAAEAAPRGIDRIPGSRTVVTRADVPTGTRAALRGSALVAGKPASTQVSQWQVDYVGFGSNTAAKAAFQRAVDVWAGIVHSTVPIKVHAEFLDLGDPDLLGQAGSNGYNKSNGDDPEGQPKIGDGVSYYPDSLSDALAGTDVYPDEPYDIYAEFNSKTTGVYYGVDGAVPGDKVDFVSIVLHELGHGLGFSGSSSYDPVTARGYFDSLSFDEDPGYMRYDRFLEKTDGTPLTAIADGSTALGSALRLPLYWRGGWAKAANSGAHVRMFSPNPFLDGSSVAHMDESTFAAGNPNSLMTPFVASGEAVHRPGTIVNGILRDLGWTTSYSAPAKVGAVTAEPGTSFVDLTWARPNDNGMGITSYTVTTTKDAGTPTSVATGSAATAFRAPIEAGHSYTFTVAATNVLGTGVASDPTGSLSSTTDTTKPLVAFVAPAAATGKSPSFAFQVSDPGRPNAILDVTCALDGGTAAPCTSPYAPVLTTSGAHTVDLTATDSDGNSETTSHAFDADAVLPVVSFSQAPPTYPVGTSVTFAFSATDDRDASPELFCQKDGGTIYACTSPQVWSGIPNGVHTFAVGAKDDRENVGSASRLFRVDTIAPTVSTTAFAQFTTAGSLAFKYAGSDPGGSGILNYDVRYRKAAWNGAFGPLTVPAGWAATTATARVLTVARGYTYCFSVRTRDRTGNLSTWSGERCTATALDERSMAASSGWTRGTASAYYASTISKATSAGRTLVRTGVQARRIAIVATTCSGCGSVFVYWNGTLLKNQSLNGIATTYRRVLPIKDLGATRAGTLTIRTTGTARVYIDGVALSRV